LKECSTYDVNGEGNPPHRISIIIMMPLTVSIPKKRAWGKTACPVKKNFELR
jgi:hypothetical protein